MGINTIKVKRVVRPLDLGDYQEEYKGAIVEVWVNPPLKTTNQVGELVKKWSQAAQRLALLEKPVDLEKNPEKKTTGANSEQGRVGSEEEIAEAREKEQAAKREYYNWFAQVWEDSSEEDIWEMVEKLEAEEPALLLFMRDRTLRMIVDYADARKKA